MALSQLNLYSNYDLIVSNPPYITEGEKVEMDKNVVDFDPHLALFVENETPLLFYQAILEFAKTQLSERGRIYLEVNQKYAEETAELYAKSGYEADVLKDLSGNNRFVIAKKA